MVARIYRPARTAAQSGHARSARWQLVHAPEVPASIEPLMGYTSASDMRSEVRLSFATLEEAVAYAQRQGIAYEVEEPHERVLRTSAYSDNFGYSRAEPWTH